MNSRVPRSPPKAWGHHLAQSCPKGAPLLTIWFLTSGIYTCEPGDVLTFQATWFAVICDPALENEGSRHDVVNSKRAELPGFSMFGPHSPGSGTGHCYVSPHVQLSSFSWYLWGPGEALQPVTITRLSLPHLWPPLDRATNHLHPPICHSTATDFGGIC